MYFAERVIAFLITLHQKHFRSKVLFSYLKIFEFFDRERERNKRKVSSDDVLPNT